MERITAPFSDETVWRLARFQRAGYMHPFTCGRREQHYFWGNEGVLIPTNSGWVCPESSCGYEQDWAYDFMIDDELFASQAAARERLFSGLNKDTWPPM